MGGGIAETISRRLDALAPDGRVGVAVSGGGDSTALLLAARDWAARTGRTLEAATVDHRLRPESAAEAAGVAELCGRLDLRHEILAWTDQPGRGNLPAAAREARIALLGEWARRRGLAAVAIGHTLDDQAETVLLRLSRGAGVDGLSGMEENVTRDGVAWIRPMLMIRRETLRAYLRAAGVSWIDDPTNDDENFARTRMRALIERNPDFEADGLAATASRLQSQRAALEWLSDDFAARALTWGALGEAALDLGELRRAPEDTHIRLFARVLRCISGAAYRPKQVALAPMMADLMGGAGVRTLHGCLASSTGDLATICREPAAAVERLPVVDGVVWDGRWRIDGAPPGTIVARLGEDGEAALAALRRSGDWTAPEAWRAAPRAARQASPAIWRENALVGAPLAGFGDARATLVECAQEWRVSRRDAPHPRAPRDVKAH